MVNLGIAGMGYIGKVHFEAAQKVPGAQVVAVASRNTAQLRDAMPAVKIYPTYQELLHDKRLQAIIVCMPTYLHEVATVEAAQHGLDILCEKAMALDADSARRMLQATLAYGRILMVAHVLRFSPWYTRIKELVDAGEIGSIRSVTSYRLAQYPPWSSWFRDPAKSGGCLLDLQVHDVDFIHWILGRPQSVRTVGIQVPNGSWDHVHTTLTYPQAHASIEATFLMPQSWPFTTGIRIVGTEGALEYGFRVRTNIQERGRASHSFRLYKDDGTVSEPRISAEVDMFEAQLRYFVRCVADRQTPRLCPPEETCQVMQVMTACQRSVLSGQVIATDDELGHSG